MQITLHAAYALDPSKSEADVTNDIYGPTARRKTAKEVTALWDSYVAQKGGLDKIPWADPSFP